MFYIGWCNQEFSPCSINERIHIVNITFIFTFRIGICGCGRSKEEHKSVSSTDSTIWNYKTHTKPQKCDSFGEIEFIGVGSKTTTALVCLF